MAPSSRYRHTESQVRDAEGRIFVLETKEEKKKEIRISPRYAHMILHGPQQDIGLGVLLEKGTKRA